MTSAFYNTLPEEDTALKDKQPHFSETLKFFSYKAELLDAPALINQLIDQIYQFSRMYWKNVSQQNLPIIIKYPEMVAEVFPFFTHDKLPDHGKKSLWFL